MHRLFQLVAVILLMTFSLADVHLLSAQSSNVPANYTGRANCPAKFDGSFRHGLSSQCWSCPANAPKRTVWAIDSNWACEKPAQTVYRKAKGPRNPTGIFKTDCQKGWFWDIGKGKCYSCQGWKRSTSHVEGAKACFSKKPIVARKASYEGEVGCDQGFEHFVSGYCYECPEGSYRNANTGSDPSEFGACTYCGTEGGKPCPVTTLRKSCDPGLVENFEKGICVIDNSHEGKVYRNAKAKAEEMLPQMAGVLTSVMMVADDEEIADGISSKNPQAASNAEAKVGANPCALNAFNAWSLGGTASVGFILGGTLETGMAVDIRKEAREGSIAQRNAFWYGAASYDISVNVGASAGINYGCWVGDNDNLLGNFEGGTFDPFGFAGVLQIKEFADIKKAFEGAGFSLEMGVWFSPESGEFQGITFTPSIGKGIGFGGYVKGYTGQFPE